MNNNRKRNNIITSKETKLKRTFFVSLFLFITSLVLQLSVTNHLALKGKEMVSLEKERAQLAKEISELELEKSQQLSLSYIQEKAYEKGYIDNPSYVYLIGANTAQASLPTL